MAFSLSYPRPSDADALSVARDLSPPRNPPSVPIAKKGVASVSVIHAMYDLRIPRMMEILSSSLSGPTPLSSLPPRLRPKSSTLQSIYATIGTGYGCNAGG